MNPKFYFLFSIFYFLFSVSITEAAVLYITPEQAQYAVGQTFGAEIKIDAQQECVNALEVNLSFPQDALKALDVSQGQSIITFWLKQPTIDQGLVSFAGIIPGGWCGRVPGDPGESNVLAKVIFKAQDKKTAEVKFSDTSQVLLNDGLGTPAKLTFNSAQFQIVQPTQGAVQPLSDEWAREMAGDKLPPEPFEVFLSNDLAIFEGRYFAIFQAVDKQTGIASYEVKEGRSPFRRGSSPYLLADQKLRSIIKVKALDKAGNERIAELLPRYPRLPWYKNYLIILVILGGIFVVYLIYLRWTGQKKKQK